MRCVITLPTTWVRASGVDGASAGNHSPHSRDVYEVEFRIPCGSKIMVDAGVRLLSLANQLHSTTRRVILNFEEGMAGTMGYLNRMGFFDHLATEIQVLPVRPAESGAKAYRGNNGELVEIASINPANRDRELPTKLADAIEHSMSDRSDRQTIGSVAFTILGELIDNVFEHSSSSLDGYAALQVYGGRKRQAMVVVSDSGLGLMETLRPSLCTEYPSVQNLPDPDLLLEMFRQGISRHGQGRGCGLKRSAEQAFRYQAGVEIRLPNSRVQMTPGNGQYEIDTLSCENNLPLLWGTHFCFTFKLDR